MKVIESLGLGQGGKEYGSWAWEPVLGIPQGKKLWCPLTQSLESSPRKIIQKKKYLNPLTFSQPVRPVGTDKGPLTVMSMVFGILAHMRNWMTSSLCLEPANQFSESLARVSYVLRTRPASVLLLPVCGSPQPAGHERVVLCFCPSCSTHMKTLHLGHFHGHGKLCQCARLSFSHLDQEVTLLCPGSHRPFIKKTLSPSACSPPLYIRPDPVQSWTSDTSHKSRCYMYYRLSINLEVHMTPSSG